MDLPALLPEKLKQYGEAESADQLFEKLRKKPAELIHFFEYACGDETWSGIDHPEFTKKMITYLTDQANHDRLDLDSIFYVAEHIHDHYDNLMTLIPHDLTIELKDGEEKTNSLLFQASSEYFHTRYRAECLKQEDPRLTVDTGIEMFKLINEFILRGDHAELWKLYPEVLFELVVVAREFELEELALMTENVLKRYVDKSNVFEMLDRSQKEEWPHLRTICMEFINRMESDIKLIPSQLNRFQFEFVVISEDALDIYHRLKDKITQLTFRGGLTKDSRLPEIMKGCKHLNSLDISDTDSFTDYLLEIPNHLEELILTNCLWLDHQNLEKLLEHCKRLQKLDLSSDVHLNVNAWAVISHFPSITQLDLRRCSQINDEDFKVILQAGHNITDLDLEDCTGISDHGFTEMARRAPDIVIANLSKTNIGDGALAEMVAHFKRLISLNLAKCVGISQKGILELVRGVSTLRVLNITGCNIPIDTVKEMKTVRPFLTVVR